MKNFREREKKMRAREKEKNDNELSLLKGNEESIQITSQSSHWLLKDEQFRWPFMREIHTEQKNTKRKFFVSEKIAGKMCFRFKNKKNVKFGKIKRKREKEIERKNK